MKTLTEFGTATLKNAIAKKQELTTAGKTAEELPAAMGEALKLEGDKLTYLLGALEVTNGQLGGDFKRVIVSALAEGESAPSSAKLIGEKYYSVEHYPPIAKKGAPSAHDSDRGGRGGRGGRDGKGRGGKGGGDKRGGRGGERGGRDAGGRGGDAAGGGRGGERGPRAPRPAAAAAGPQGSGALPKPLSKPLNTPPAAAPAASEGETPSSGS